ncbi:MAG: hypothetical protein ABJN66_08340 [Gilvibacter sp.]
MTGKKSFECASGKEHTFVVKQAKLVQVELLDGAEGKFLPKGGKQFVNLDRDNKWVDNQSVTSLGRLGYKPKIYVKFDLPGVSEFTIKAIPDAKNPPYTDDEKNRNSLFKFIEEEKTYQTESTGELVISDAFLSVGGKSTFYFEVKDTQGTTLKTKKLETLRKVFVQQIKMTGDAGKSAANSISTVESEYKKQGFIIESLPEKNMPEMENIGANDSTTYKNAVKTAYQSSEGKKKEPHSLVVGYTSHLAVKTTGRQLSKINVSVGPGSSAITINIAGPGKTNPAVRTKYLWQEIVSGESWFESASFEDATSGVVTAIDEKYCTAIAVNAANPNASSKVKIDVSKLPRGTGTVTLKVTWVDRMRAGLSFGGSNLICVCTKAWWKNKSLAQQNEVIIHEMGHKIGMVPGGTGKLPDKTDTFYDSSKGHVGTHCHHGIPAGQARYDSATDASLSDCVMYGSTNSHSAFCEHCSVAAKKQDINSGWSAL